MLAGTWFPLSVRSTYSATRGLAKVDRILARLKECGYEGAALTDYCGAAGIPSFLRDAQKAKLKGLAGLELLCRPEDPTRPSRSRLFLIARDQSSWKNLSRIVTASNDPATYKGFPSLSLDGLKPYAEGLFAYSGHTWTTLADSLFERPAQAYLAPSYEDVKGLLRKDWSQRLLQEIERYRTLFGHSLYLSVQLVDAETFPASRLLAEAMRWVAKHTGLRTLAVADTHYMKQEDAADHRVLLCSELKTTLNNVHAALTKQDDGRLCTFFRCSQYHLPTLEEMRALHPENELAASLEIAALCEPPQTDGRPLMPDFRPPDKSSCEQYFRFLCREGWKKKIDPMLKSLPPNLRQEKRKEYGDRAKMELDVLCSAELSPQFLVVEDYVRFARSFSLPGCGRGSVGGCLVAYLLNITQADPIKYDLLFERFFSAGKVVAGKLTSLADIDMDFQVGAREPLFRYLQEKYGPDKVCQMGTFNKLKGRSALQTVLKAHSRFSQEELFTITKTVPDPASITDDLQAMAEESDDAEDATTIRWVLENEPDSLKEWCRIGPSGELEGDLAGDFAQAMRLEGCVVHMGKHAGGIIISPVPVHEVVPLCYDKGGEGLIAGWDMVECEKAGLTKFDILGVACLDRISVFQQIVKTGSYSTL